VHERRVFLALSGLPEQLVGSQITLSEPDSKHLATVLRIGVGDPVTVVDSISGAEYQSFVTSVSKLVTVQLDNRLNSKQYKSVVDTLAVGMCKLAATEFIVEKATELGVRKIALILSDHCVVKLKGDKEIKAKNDRFTKIALEASKQSSRTSIPQVQIYESLNNFLLAEPSVYKFVGSLSDQACKIQQVLNPQIASDGVCVLIGPEGDFSTQELGALKQHNAQFFTLGGNRLRSETAVIAAIAAFDAVATSIK
jgi:16S rRNA (uracil1498-N3)-methyltransferase